MTLENSDESQGDRIQEKVVNQKVLLSMDPKLYQQCQAFRNTVNF